MHDRFGPARAAGPDGMSDLERLLAYEEIRQLAARYAPGDSVPWVRFPGQDKEAK